MPFMICFLIFLDDLLRRRPCRPPVKVLSLAEFIPPLFFNDSGAQSRCLSVNFIPVILALGAIGFFGFPFRIFFV